MSAVLGFHSITAADIRKSFQGTGIFPVNWDCAQMFENIKDTICRKITFLKLTWSPIGSCPFEDVPSLHEKRTAISIAYGSLLAEDN